MVLARRRSDGNVQCSVKVWNCLKQYEGHIPSLCEHSCNIYITAYVTNNITIHTAKTLHGKQQNQLDTKRRVKASPLLGMLQILCIWFHPLPYPHHVSMSLVSANCWYFLFSGRSFYVCNSHPIPSLELGALQCFIKRNAGNLSHI